MEDKKTKDEFMIGPQLSERGERVALRKAPDGGVSTCVVKKVADGTPLNGLPGDVFHLEPVGQNVYAGERIHEGTHKGPARVATMAYRDGWDKVFN